MLSADVPNFVFVTNHNTVLEKLGTSALNASGPPNSETGEKYFTYITLMTVHVL